MRSKLKTKFTLLALLSGLLAPMATSASGTQILSVNLAVLHEQSKYLADTRADWANRLTVMADKHAREAAALERAATKLQERLGSLDAAARTEALGELKQNTDAMVIRHQSEREAYETAAARADQQASLRIEEAAEALALLKGAIAVILESALAGQPPLYGQVIIEDGTEELARLIDRKAGL